MLYAFLKPLVRALLRLLFRYRAIGGDRVPRTGPVILASNHLSFLDPPLVAAGTQRPLDFLGKAELFRVPGFGRLIRTLRAHPVQREGSGASTALRLGLDLLRRDRALLVFPEGTRGREGTLGPGRPGVGMLATLSGAPVVPVYIRGSGRALPRGATWPRPARITVVYGAPLVFDRGRGRERYQAASDEIMAAIGRLKAWLDGVAGSDQEARTAAPGAVPAGQSH